MVDITGPTEHGLGISWHAVAQIAAPGGVVSVFVGFFGVIPVILGIIGGLFAIAYYALSIYEMKTFQEWRKNRHAYKTARRVAVLQTQQSAIVGELKRLGVLTHADTTVEGDKTVHSITTVETKTPQP